MKLPKLFKLIQEIDNLEVESGLHAKLQHPPGKPLAFDHHLCPGVGNLTNRVFPELENFAFA